MFIFVVIKRYRSNNESYKGTNTEDPDIDFEQLVNQTEDEEDEDWGLPPEPEIEATPRRDENRKLGCWRGQERGQGWHGHDYTYPG